MIHAHRFAAASIVLAIASLGCGGASASTMHPGLVALHYLGLSPEGEYLVSSQRSSRVFVSFDSVYNQTWHVWFEYSGCPRTYKGAFRFTVYRAQGLHRLSNVTLTRVPKEAIQYSRPVVDFKREDSSEYAFPGRADTYYFYKIDVPGSRGCQEWKLGATTN